jgi:hypothetical protein
MNTFNWVTEYGEPLDPIYRWFVIDSDGLGYVFTHIPELTNSQWQTTGPWFSSLRYLVVSRPLLTDWKTSLISRY